MEIASSGPILPAVPARGHAEDATGAPSGSPAPTQLSPSASDKCTRPPVANSSAISDTAGCPLPAASYKQHLLFLGLLALGAVMFFSPLATLGEIALDNDTYSHIPLIPLVTVFLIFIERASVFSATARKPAVGIPVCAGGLLLYVAAQVFHAHLDRLAFRHRDIANDYLTLCLAGAVVYVIGSFIAIYGVEAFNKARFALLFLVFAVPIPVFLLNKIIVVLQHASADAANIVFGLTGVAYIRNDLVFEFSNVSVQVAEECSGIRSSLSLFILSVITGHMFLRTTSRRIVLSLAIFPITVVKNAFRIVTITLLANYVDMRFLTKHWLHSSGGIPFFFVALALFIPLVWMLRKGETTAGSGQRAAGGKS